MKRKSRDRKESKIPTGSSHFCNIQYASWYRWLFINSNPQVLPIHTNSVHTALRPVPVLMDAVPLRGPEQPLEEPTRKRERYERGWLRVQRKQGMIRNIRPDREIQHTSKRSDAIYYPFHPPQPFSILPPPSYSRGDNVFGRFVFPGCHQGCFIVVSTLSPVPTIGSANPFSSSKEYSIAREIYRREPLLRLRSECLSRGNPNVLVLPSGIGGVEVWKDL